MAKSDQLLSVGALLLAAAALLFSAPRTHAAEARHLILISVDTLRADALGTYGYPADVSPRLDRLAAEGVLFEDVITTIGKTGPAFASLFTSLYPPTHGARRNGVAMRPDVPTLAELLRDSGFDTAAFISNWTLRSRLAAVHRGFQHYDEEFTRKRNAFGAHERDAPTLIRAAIEWLGGRTDRSRPLFLWVHLSEPHTPFELHDNFVLKPPPKNERRSGWQKRWRYASEVKFTDHQIGRLLEQMKELVDLDRALIVFVADHGESLGEHGYWGHGKNARWPNLRIPLILVGPDLPAGKRVATPASIIDVMPTVLELLGIGEPEGLAGNSLRHYWQGDTPQERARFAIGDRHTAWGKGSRNVWEEPLEISLQTPSTKVVFNFEKRQTIYFDLLADPQELTPLSDSPRPMKPPLRRLLANWFRQLPKYDQRSGELSEEDVRQLKSLGYVGER